MFKHLLIATDGSRLSEDAARSAIALAKSLGARVTAMTASLPYRIFTAEYVMVSDTEDAYNQECRNRAEQYLAAIKKAAQAAGVPCDEVHTFNEQAHAAIIETAEQRGCDLICMASHGRSGLTALVVGSVTMKVLTHSRIPVLVWR
ncbi:MAG TPA: universal stress protein [Casimicrobiaceae bacterium]